ncbi:MAG: hypothetical protein ACYS15_18220 [Planctomycetota bacterium]|jgi:hypothetical protein
MTTIGILNIIFGTLFSLVFLLMILGAGFMAAAGSAMGGEDGAAVAAGGGFLMLVGIAAFAINLMLFISGIGVLKVAPWGRSLSVACGGLGVIVYSASLVAGGFSIPMLGMLAYSVVLIGLFFTPKWKTAFCSCESGQQLTDSVPATPEAPPEAAPEASESEETREAA